MAQSSCTTYANCRTSIALGDLSRRTSSVSCRHGGGSRSLSVSPATGGFTPVNTTVPEFVNTWRAGCGESRPSGSEGVVTRSCGCICSDWSYDQDLTRCATTGTLPGRAAGITWRCEALGTTNPHPIRVAGHPAREPDDCQRHGGRGPGLMAWLTQVNCR